MSKSLKDKVPENFWKADLKTPQGRTVGDLIQILQKLPRHLPINSSYALDVEPTFFVIVYNISEKPRCHVIIEDSDIFGD